MRSFRAFNNLIESKQRQPIAVWVVGGAATGKSTIADIAILRAFKFKLIDPDEPMEKILKKFNLGNEIKNDSPEEKARKAELRKQGKIKTVAVKDLDDPMDYFKIKPPSTNSAAAVGREITRRAREAAILNRMNICFVDTGVQVGATRNLKQQLEDIGYKTFVVYVGIHPRLDMTKKANFDKVVNTIQQRSNKRAKAGGRQLSPDILKKSLEGQEKVKAQLLPLFGRNVLVVDSASGSLKQNATAVRAAVRKLF